MAHCGYAVKGRRGLRSSLMWWMAVIVMAGYYAQTGHAADTAGDSGQAGNAAAASPGSKSLWINPGLYSIHFQDKGYNNDNWGVGLEYRYSDSQSIAVGGFNNSDSKTSHYLSWYWQPFAIGPVKLGATFGALDGYPDYHDGGWFLAAIPAATYEGNRFGLNVLLVPSYKDKLHGALSFQLKYRLY